MQARCTIKCGQVLAGAVALMASVNIQTAFAKAFVAGATDISQPSAYDDGQLPAPGETVLLTNGTVHVTYGTAGWTTLNSLGKVFGLSPRGARLEITVPTGETADLTTPVTGHGGEQYFAWRYGGIVKKGDGELRLAANTLSGNDYFSPLDVDEGTLTLLAPYSGYNFYGAVTVKSGAVCDIRKGSSTYILMHGFFGDGRVTNGGGGTVQLCFHGNSDEPGDFGGAWDGAFQVKNMDDGSQRLRGTAISISDRIDIEHRLIGAEYIGNASTPSSLGPKTSWILGGTLEYLGKGEASDRSFYLAATDFSFSGGPVGGLDLAAALTWPGAGPQDRMIRMTLSGTNANECVYRGTTPADWTIDGTPRALCLQKTESGTWRLAENYQRLHGGSLQVLGGTLAFDTVEEAGRVSSMGLATNRTDCYCGAYDPARGNKPYAILLGAEDSDVPAVLAFSGTTSQTCETRPIRLVGPGTFRNDGTATIRWAHVAADDRSRTLTLDGSSVCTNEMADVEDGTEGGVLSVCKKGTGTWALGGDVTFGGSLDVQEGTLIVRKAVTNQYTWFRWTVKETGGGSGYSFNIYELALADAANARIGTKLTASTDVACLRPGEIGLGTRYVLTTMELGRLTDMLHNFVNGSFAPNVHYPTWGSSEPVWSKTCTPRADDPKTWIPFVLRVKENSNPISSWDFCGRNGATNAGTPIITSLEGSVDGLHWELIDEQDYSDVCDDAKSAATWVFSGAAISTVSSSSHAGGRSVSSGFSARTYSVLDNVASVSVAKNAVLEADGDVVLSKLTIDATNAGTVKGFSFAEEGELNVVNLPKGSAVEMPATFDGVTGLENLANWTLKVGGVQTDRKRICVKDGKVFILSDGLIIIFR